MSKKWLINSKQASAEDIKNNQDINPVISQLLFNRGLSAEQAKRFLALNYEAQLYDPFLFKQMKEVVALINKHLQACNKIIVYGDYDADGVCATAIMYKTLIFLATLGKAEPAAKIDIYIPDRASEGYGLKKSAIKHLADSGAKLIVTVDNATRNVGEVEYAKYLGLDIIITDHHEPGPETPDCLIINPKIEYETYPFFSLAGCGVAFKLAQALLSITDGSDVFLKWLLDLVAIGTIADLVPLVDENRVLVKYGLVVLNKTSRIGLKKLIEVARSGVDKNGNGREIDSWQVGFQIAPRLNAAGRLDHANTAYELLITEDEKEAVKIAEQLNTTNQERQRLTDEIFQYADNALTSQPSLMEGEKAQKDALLCAIWPGLLSHILGDEEKITPSPATIGAGEGGGEGAWSAGIMGLVAGKLTEKYYRPSLAITEKNGPAYASIDAKGIADKKASAGKEEIVGSGRSIMEFDITAMLEECAEFLTNFGGHKQACGFTLKNREALEPFLAKARKIVAEKLAGLELAPTLEIDLEINFQDVREELYNALQKLRPFGVDNPQPKFLTKNLTVVNVFNMGADGQHIKLKVHPVKYSPSEFNGVKSEKHAPSNNMGSKVMDAVAFSVIDEWKQIKVGDKIDLVYYIDMNEWNGNRNIQLKIIDLKSI